MNDAITPELLLQAYRAGVFPMADDADSAELYWYDPPERTHFPLAQFHVPSRLRRTIRRWPYHISVNCAFPRVMQGCATPNAERGRDRTWINAEIHALYGALHRMGHAHSVEAWHGTELVGGLYGVQIGGAFFGESMFSTMTDASKICLVTLVALLRAARFELLDCQFMTAHLARFGAQTVSRAHYRQLLARATALQCSGGILSPAGFSGAAIGGTYPGTGTGKPSAGTGGLAGVSADTAAAAGDVAVAGPDDGTGTLAAVVMGFLQEITQTS